MKGLHMEVTRRLPDLWVQKIFATLQGNYGSRFINLYKTGQQLEDGRDAGIVNAMNEWAEKLGGYQDSPDTFKSVLDALPKDPPVLPVFRELMRVAYVKPKHLEITKVWTEEELERNRARAAKELKKINFILQEKI